MKINRLSFAALAASVVFGLCVICAIVTMVAYNQPLGPSLGLPTSTHELVDQTAVALGSTPAAAGTATSQPLCGGPAVMNLLLIGSDTRENTYLYGLADAIRLVHVDFTAPRVTAIEMPRDLWVEIPDISSHYGITHGKLNQAYLYGNPGMGYYAGPGQGPGLLARTLDQNFGAKPEHYVAANLHTFSAIVDALGGLDVYLPYDLDMRTPQYPDAFHISSGQHHLDGNTALWVARVRQYTVFGRAQSQDIVLCALRKKLTSPAVLPRIPAIIQQFQNSIQTDLSLDQINQLACLATGMDGRNVVFASLPIKLFKSERTYDPMLKANVFIFTADFNILQDYIGRFQQGTWPDPADVIQNTPSPADLDSEFTCN